MVDNQSKNAGNPSGRGHQIMPAMTFANGRLTLLYYDLRLDHYAGIYNPNPASPGNYVETLQAEGELAGFNPNPGEVFTTYIDDAGLTLRRHTLDLRVLQLGIFPTVVLGPSVLVSQYDYGCCVNPESPDIEQFKFNVPNLPLFEQGQEPFLGDYIDIVPSPMFVPSGNSWAYNFTPSVNPLFHATWTDNRDVVPPPPGGSWENYTPAVPAGTTSVFEPGTALPVCVPGQEGMRNQNIYTSQITGGLVVGAPGNAKPLGTTTFNGQTVPFQRAFPVEAQNITGQPITVRFTIANQPTGGTASFLQFSLLTTLDVTIAPYSSVSRSVFATSTNPEATITVNVAQITGLGGSVVTNGLSSSAVLNPDITNPNITNPNITNPNITNPNITNAETTNPNITNPNITNPNITNTDTENPNITNPNITNNSYLNPNITNPNVTNENVDNVSATNPNITNPNITNPNITNPNITNPNITNPNITNPDITNGSVSDVIYPITNNGNTTSSYTVKTATNGTVPGGIVLQLIVNKLYQTPVANNCQLGVQTHWITVANIVNPKLFTVADPNITNPDITNGTPNEATVTLAPGETAYITVRVVNPSPTTISFNPLTVITPVTVPQAVNTTTVLSNPGNPNLTAPPVYAPLSILTATLPATDRFDAGYSVQLLASGGKPGADTWSITTGALPPGMNLSPTGLVSGTATIPGSYAVTIQVADSSVPPNVTVQNYTLNVSVTPLTEQFVLVPPDGVVGQPYVATPLAVNGGTAPYTWTATGLPAGLQINPSTGQIGGTPKLAIPGGSAVTITATDAAFPAESVPYNTTIRTGAPLAIGPATLPTGTIGVAYAAQLTATGGIGGYGFGPPSPAPGVFLDGNGNLTIPNPQATTITFSVSLHDGSQPTFQTATANYTITFAGTAGGFVTFQTEPANSIGGQTLAGSPINVLVQDSFGAVIPGANVTMAFTGAPPCAAATLGGTLTEQTNAVGVATFPNLNVNFGQNGYTLRATTGGVSGASTPFNVSGFCDTGAINTARHNQIVITLPNGKILVTGGATNPDNTGVLASAEVFDPATHAFTAISPMNVARADHSMTLLNDGTVLVAGGFNDTGVVSSAEIFNPVNNTFTLLGNAMTSLRAQHVATPLPNGKVLLTGGNTNTTTLATAELYDPGAQTFTATTQSMTAPRQIHHADLLPNGKVLIAGGFDVNNNALNSAEIYDPVAGTFTPTGPMTTGRGNHATALLYNGLLLVAGGLTGPGTGLTFTATAELYNPTTGQFTPTGGMSIPRAHYTAMTLADGTVLIQGGAGLGALPNGTNADIYNPATGQFTTTGNFTQNQTGQREGLLFDNTVLLTSGVNAADVAVTNDELFYPPAVPPGIVVTTAGTLPTAIQGQPYAQILLEHGGIGNVRWNAASTPPGLALLPNGMLTGIPLVNGAFAINVLTSDSSGQEVLTTFALQIQPGLTITTVSLPNGEEGFSYSAQIFTANGTPPISFSLTNASFPPGLTIAQPPTTPTWDTLSGTPTQAGVFTFSESVADSGSPQQTTSQSYTLTIFPQPPGGLIGSPQGPGIITLTWTASPSGDIAGYRVRRGLSSGNYNTIINAGTDNSYVDTGLTSGTKYFYVVSAVSTSGVESAVTNEVSVTSP